MENNPLPFSKVLAVFIILKNPDGGIYMDMNFKPDNLEPAEILLAFYEWLGSTIQKHENN